MSAITKYDKRELFDQEVKPLLSKIESVCKSSGIPFFFSAATESSDTGTTYENYACSALPMGIFLLNDHFVEHIKVSAGFKTTIPDSIPDIELN